MADTGAYCSVYNPPYGSGNWVIQCNQRQLPQVASFNIMPRANFTDEIRTRTPLTLAMRPGPATPAGIMKDGLIYSNLSAPVARFAFEITPGTSNLSIPFGRGGTQLLYLSAVTNGTRMYCRIDTHYPMMVNATTTLILPNALRCDQTSFRNGSQFSIKPLGWSWLSKRIMFKSVMTNKTCGNAWFTHSPTYITCDGGMAAMKAGQEWRNDMATNVMRMPMVPMRSKAEFMIQSWIEYPLPTSVWVTDLNSYLQAGNFIPSSRPRAPPGDLPYLSMLKAQGPTSNATIGSGDRVLLRSSRNGRYCMVVEKSYRVQCLASLHDIQCLDDRSAYQFIYMEFTPM